ncbi:Mediator of RNA polymerase II transcription subunit 14 [Escovopsis weberi]|uniref:Mediator of RNA polymerase II transcription subunit 14 n=1 Tax=Escovopsis weberi TaxID=150374 RepID=A0A0M9VVL6_ESCWE|nr:Mediator of RNA polymerase II transcription subunit 14 [Escovopsis weberi]
MEKGGPDGARTDHPREAALNGTGGAKSIDRSRSAASQKGKVTPVSNEPGGVNGQDGGSRSRQQSADRSLRMNDLPDEIIHITQGFVPLQLFLTRLAQVTHNSIQDKMAELAKMPVPASATNGNSSHAVTAPDDASAENIRKKAALLHFAHDMHSKWVKALVIMEWSRKAAKVSKLIDLKFLLDQQRIVFDAALDHAINVKRDLTYARMPSPDLKTALQTLSTGTAPYMPDLQYIEPPPLTPDVQLKWINELNTLLSLRLNLEDYEKIPFHFRTYEISSGRVTFKVPGEFEVDLTIADEDFEKQFWFLDFRYAFAPAASSLPESLRGHLEGCVNDALAKDGLTGCYQFLHEFVLTSKINELKRQALQLSRSSWFGSLKVEPLNRALAVQYWTSRNQSTGLKSWILVAVHSRRKQDGRHDPKTSSRLVAKWYRDNKEVKDVELELDASHLSAETLLKTVIGRHIEHVLASIYDRLLTAPRFQKREAGMTLRISETDPGASALSVQVGCRGTVSLMIEHTTGVFSVKPNSKFSFHHELQLNNGKNPAEDGMNCLENVRCGIAEDELVRSATSMGWFVRKGVMSAEELRAKTKIRDWTRVIWLQRDGLGPSWFVVVILGLGGDEWWLLESHAGEPSNWPRFQSRLPLNKGYPDLAESFWTNLTLFTTGTITQAVDMRELYHRQIQSRTNDSLNLTLPQEVRLPSIEVALSELLPAIGVGDSDKETILPPSDGTEMQDTSEVLNLLNRDSETAPSKKQCWAHNNVTIRFQGVRNLVRPSPSEGTAGSNEMICITDAVIRVRRPSKFTTLNKTVDHDVSYCAQKGEFTLRMRRSATQPVIAALLPRIKAIDRFVNFLEAMHGPNGAITSESATLKRVTFNYCKPSVVQQGEEMPPSSRRWRVTMDLAKDDINIEMEPGNPHLRVIDLVKRMVNCEGGIGALMTWLPSSLPALDAINKIESQWDELEARGLGQFRFSMWTATSMHLAFTIFGPNGTDTASPTRLSLEAQIKIRRGEAWWNIWRPDKDAAGALPDDELAKALKPIWGGRGKDWLGLSTSAAGRLGDGVSNMLSAIDEAVRSLAPAPGAEVAKMGVGATAGPFPPRIGASGNGDYAPAPVVVLD